MHILFYDIAAPYLYTTRTLTQQGMGGTEATIVRIANGLKKYGRVSVAQRLRPKAQNVIDEDVDYVSLCTAHQFSPDIVVLLQSYRHLTELRNHFPKSRLFYWTHNFPSKNLHQTRHLLNNLGYEIIAVSNFHQRKIQMRLMGKWYQQLFSKLKMNIPIHILYNPIDDHLHPSQTVWRPNQLLFMSSTYKGLNQAVQKFYQVSRYFPDLELLITNEQSFKIAKEFTSKIAWLGRLKRDSLMQKVRESFCIFYPQTIRAETFGLVYAEANAVGTPVLAHNFGAAAEVLSDQNQLINGHRIQEIIEKLSAWQNTRPNILPQERFRLSRIIEDWRGLLGL